MAARKAKGSSGAGKKPLEQYHHKGKQRANNPPVGLVKPENDPGGAKHACVFDPHLDPQLQWARKVEHASFGVPTVSLHERTDATCVDSRS